ncbi:hypothetical protein [Flavobacterium sp. 3HN19-14]|uniref:hypothetical protein n=1 Tax=Flavobacterium sp. 3HN19-14 TaxID=3448133 RepID=UPI003EE2B401
MKKCPWLLLLLFVAVSSAQQGKIVVTALNSKSLQNTAGENPKRRITVYLPPGTTLRQNDIPLFTSCTDLRGATACWSPVTILINCLTKRSPQEK